MVDHSQDKNAGATLLMQIGRQSVKNRSDVALASSQNLGSNDFFHQTLGGSPVSGRNWDDLVTCRVLSETSPMESNSDEAMFEAALRNWGDQPDAAALALLATIFHKATLAHDDRLFFHYWLSENMRRWLGPRGFDLPARGGVLTSLRQRIQNMLTMGINLRGRSPAEFLAAQFQLAGEVGYAPSGAGQVLDSIVAAASFAGAGLLETVDVLSMLPHNRGDVCGCFGLLAGTFYGKNRLMELETLGEPLPAFLCQDESEKGEL